MGNNITLKLKYKESVVKFSYKYGVTKAAIKFCECRRTIYRWRQRYDGSLESLKDKCRKPHYHPNQHTAEEIKMIKVIKKKIVHTTVQFIHDLKRSWYSCIIKIKYRFMNLSVW